MPLTHLDQTFAALADPTRRAILARLATGEATVTELARPFEISLPAVSRHLKVLERAGLIARGREAQWRPRTLQADPLKEAADWLNQYRRFWEQSFDRLEEYMGELQGKRSGDATGRELTVSRMIDAPCPLVFKAWTDPDQIARWWGPKGFVTVDYEMDVRPGGAYRFRMRSPDGIDFRKRGAYREIVEPERLVFTFAWEEPDGSLGHETLITVTFEALGTKTRLTLRQGAFDATANRESHIAGWTSCLERFGDYMTSGMGE